MKLLPILAGTLLREAHAVCNSGDPIIRVTCHEDLMVQLEGTKFYIVWYNETKFSSEPRVFGGKVSRRQSH